MIRRQVNMSNVVSYLVILLFTFFSCHTVDRETMEIKGKIPSVQDGQIIYLVPRPHPTSETVDSAYIQNGTFFFSIPADSAIYDLTIGRRTKTYVQRLLIIAEKGTLHVSMGENSSSNGTPLNNQLQHWKEQMEASEEAAALLSQKINKNKGNDTLIATLRKQKERVYENFGDSTFCFIKQNLNPLGGYLFMTLENMFSEQQTHELKQLGIEKWKPKP